MFISECSLHNHNTNSNILPTIVCNIILNALLFVMECALIIAFELIPAIENDLKIIKYQRYLLFAFPPMPHIISQIYTLH